MLAKSDVVVFDFDGTLSGRDSNVEFAKYCFRHSIRPWFYLPLMAAAGVASAFNKGGVWWRENIRRFLTPDMVARFADDFVSVHLRERFGWAAERVAAERAAGNKVVLISASAHYVLRPLVRDMKFDAVMCSEMDDARPWKYHFLCWGPNKVVALDNWAAKNKIIPRVVRSYSDSINDMPLMEIAANRIWIDKKTGLRKSEK